MPIPLPANRKMIARSLRALNTHSETGNAIVQSAATLIETLSAEVERLRARDNSKCLLAIQEPTTTNEDSFVAQADLLAHRFVLERFRQLKIYGFNEERDREYRAGELLLASACYALSASGQDNEAHIRALWPWAAEHFRPSSPDRDTDKAGALLIADAQRRNAPQAAA